MGKRIDLHLPNRVLRHRYKDASDPQQPPLPNGMQQSSVWPDSEHGQAQTVLKMRVAKTKTKLVKAKSMAKGKAV